MATEDSHYVWIKEPVIVDESFATYDESTLHWLERSTNRRARDSRFFINYNLGKIPEGYRELFIQKLTFDWRSAIFELILARYLQELGANILYEQPIKGGKQPDFTVNFPDKSVVIEAISPVFDSKLINLEKNNVPLINYIEKNKPKGWLILILRLPHIGPSDSKKEFKKKIDSIIKQIQTASKNELSFSETISSGEIALECTKTNKDYKRISGGPILTSWGDSEERIKHALNKKRPQVRDSVLPVILAINASGISSEMEDFNYTLYGHSVDVIDYRDSTIRRSNFKEDGLFTKRKKIDPTYAGILACFTYGLAGGSPPVLFHNPNFHGHLPDELLQLEQRRYNFKSMSIEKVCLKDNGLLQKLKFPIH